MKLCCRLFLIALALITALPVGMAQEDLSTLRLRELFASQREKVTWSSSEELISYADYSVLHENAANYAGEPIQGEITAPDGQSARILLRVEEAALYTIFYAYACPQSESNLFASFSLDGEIPFREAASMAFDWLWQEESKPIMNVIGDEVRPRQMRVSDRHARYFTNTDGFVSGALRFYLAPGLHEIDLAFASVPVVIETFELRAPAVVSPYETVLAEAIAQGFELADTVIAIEAEDAVVRKNAASIMRVVSDDPMSTPYEIGYKRLNTYGGDTCQNANEFITWTISVPKDGLYTISLRCSTPTDQLPIYRRLEIDDALPFAEAACVLFPYMDNLQVYALPQLFPLTAGEHTLTLTVDVSEYAAVVNTLQAVNDELSEIMLNLTMLVGTNPDSNYDYNIEKSLPTLSDDLSRMNGTLNDMCARLHALCEGTSLAENSIRQNAELLLSVQRNIKRIQNSITDIATIQTNLSLWTEELMLSPLLIDRIFIGAAVDDPMTANLAQKANVLLYNFMLSFSKDYDQIGSRSSGENDVVLDVWISTSTEAADVLKTLCDASFTAQTGIHINLNILPSGQLNAGAVNVLLLSIVSGNQPDVALGVSAGTPVELAIRDAVVDLSKLPGYERVASQVPQNALTVNSFNGGVYGIPERLGFTAMFYRKDILSAIELSLPETWQDVYNETLPILYQNSLEMLVPHNFAMFLYQYGGSFYDADGLTAALDTPEGYQAFKAMIELYTKYAIPYTTNFYNRFRSGEMAIGIAGFGDYMSLTVGARNLSGKWGIAPVPGTVREDGTVSHATSGMVESSAVIMRSSKKQEASWEFLQWWLSADTQYEYAREIEKRIGLGARVNTANTEAFSRLDWPAEDLAVLLEARENAVETPGVLGGFYANRHMTNAWNAIITDDKQSVRDEFEHAVEMIQAEMDSKQEEYSHLLERR